MIFNVECMKNFSNESTGHDKVLRYIEEYDQAIPDVTLAQFLIERMRLFGNDVAIVSASYFCHQATFIPPLT